MCQISPMNRTGAGDILTTISKTKTNDINIFEIDSYFRSNIQKNVCCITKELNLKMLAYSPPDKSSANLNLISVLLYALNWMNSFMAKWYSSAISLSGFLIKKFVLLTTT